MEDGECCMEDSEDDIDPWPCSLNSDDEADVLAMVSRHSSNSSERKTALIDFTDCIGLTRKDVKSNQSVYTPPPIKRKKAKQSIIPSRQSKRIKIKSEEIDNSPINRKINSSNPIRAPYHGNDLSHALATALNVEQRRVIHDQMNTREAEKPNYNLQHPSRFYPSAMSQDKPQPHNKLTNVCDATSDYRDFSMNGQSAVGQTENAKATTQYPHNKLERQTSVPYSHPPSTSSSNNSAYKEKAPSTIPNQRQRVHTCPTLDGSKSSYPVRASRDLTAALSYPVHAKETDAPNNYLSTNRSTVSEESARLTIAQVVITDIECSPRIKYGNVSAKYSNTTLHRNTWDSKAFTQGEPISNTAVSALKTSQRNKVASHQKLQMSCPECDITTIGWQKLLRHLARTHHIGPDAKPYRLCDEHMVAKRGPNYKDIGVLVEGTSSDALRSSQRHNDINSAKTEMWRRTYTCPDCDFLSDHWRNLLRHIARTHHIGIDKGPYHETEEYIIAKRGPNWRQIYATKSLEQLEPPAKSEPSTVERTRRKNDRNYAVNSTAVQGPNGRGKADVNIKQEKFEDVLTMQTSPFVVSSRKRSQSMSSIPQTNRIPCISLAPEPVVHLGAGDIVDAAPTAANHEQSHQHMASVYSCAVCGFETKIKHKLNSHRFLSRQQGPLTCQVCGEEFYTCGGYRVHMRKHKNRGTDGTQSSNRSQSSDDRRRAAYTGEITTMLETGMKAQSINRRHSSYRDVPLACRTEVHCGAKHSEGPHEYQCAGCLKGFPRKYALQRHLQNVYHCDICGYKMKHGETVDIHRRHHNTGDMSRSAQCDTCRQVFPDKCYLQKHIYRNKI